MLDQEELLQEWFDYGMGEKKWTFDIVYWYAYDIYEAP